MTHTGISENEPRRYKAGLGPTGEHKVTGVADFAVAITWPDGSTGVRERPDYDNNTEPVLSFAAGDVVRVDGYVGVVTEYDSYDGSWWVRYTSTDGQWEAAADLEPTGGHVAVLDEDRWYVVTSDGIMFPAEDYEDAEKAREAINAVAIVTIRNGAVVERLRPDYPGGVAYLLPAISRKLS